LKETADVVDSIDIVKTDGRFQTLSRIDLNFGYRSSSFQYMEDLAAIVAVTFRLHPSGSTKKRLQEYLNR
jgi:UDP-N-acetylenolpyruvoylglucosamine reductase